MIDKTHRFQGYTSLSFVFKRGETIRGAQLSLRYVRNTRRQSYRVAVVVSRKVHKSAAVRNRIRRRIYESVRLCGEAITGPYDLVFVVYGEQLAEMPAAQLQQLVRQELLSAGVLAATSR